jgi:hypothetical protein
MKPIKKVDLVKPIKKLERKNPNMKRKQTLADRNKNSQGKKNSK